MYIFLTILVVVLFFEMCTEEKGNRYIVPFCVCVVCMMIIYLLEGRL